MPLTIAQFKSLDPFKQPVSLMLNGESAVRTVYGSIYLCFAIVMVIIFSSVRLADQANRSPEVQIRNRYVSGADFSTNSFEITGAPIASKQK